MRRTTNGVGAIRMANISEWFGKWGKGRKLDKVGKPLPHLPCDYQLVPSQMEWLQGSKGEKEEKP